MAKYKLLTNLIVNTEDGQGATKFAGDTVELNDEQAEGFLKRGSVVEYDENAEQEEVEAEDPELTGEVVEEFEAGGNTYQKRQEFDGAYSYAINGVKLDEIAYTNALQAKVAADAAAKAQKESSHPVQENPAGDSQSLEVSDRSGTPSQEEIDAALAAENEGRANNEVTLD